jgi:ABC-type transport system substrate-binding protein
VAREVVEFYGDKIAEHPVGTGPFRLAQWRRSSLIVLERNPTYRERLWDAEPAPDDAEGQAILPPAAGPAPAAGGPRGVPSSKKRSRAG